MKTCKRLLSLSILVLLVIVLGSCSENAENEHLPEYCQTYTGFMEFASPDIYEKMEGINSRNYLTKISIIDLEWEEDDPFKEIDLDGIQCFQNLTSLTLIGQSFKDISEISALSNIQQITLDSTSVVDISSFKNLSKVKDLNITNTKTLQSVDGVEEMTKLESLTLTYNGIVNIDGLNNLVNLTYLDLSNNEIRFFPSISNLEFLNTLIIANNQIEYLDDDLSGLRNLKTLDARNNQIDDISSLDDLENLEILDLSFNDLGASGGSPDFSSLVHATKLHTLYLNDNGLTSISDLAGKSLPLETLHLQNNELSDLSPIADYTTITDLQIYSNDIVNISNLSGMSGLTEINLSDNAIEDFSNLRSIPNLEFIYLNDNNITAIPDISGVWPDLNTLDLSRNVVEDTSGVEGHPSLRILKLTDNGLDELEGISNLPELTTLELTYPVDEITGETEINPLTGENFVEVNPNQIRIIRNSFNSVPNLPLDDDGDLDFGFTLAENAEIYGSFIGLNDITGVILSDLGIDIIDEFSFTSTEIGGFILDGNNLTNIDFLRGNPAVIYIDISGNPVTNLDLLNGDLYDDFDNLQQFHATSLPSVIALDGAFVGLNDLTLIDMTDTSVSSINGSFVNLSQLIEFHLDGSELTTITDSFNNIFATHNVNNVINFSDGQLESIINSFNTGFYEQIVIANQAPLTTETTITDSFISLEINNTQSMGISSNHFKTITGSFLDITADNVYIMNNATESITTSFTNLDLTNELNLQNNELQTLDLSLVTNVVTLDLSNNALTTVSFVDGIPGLTELDISNQQATIDDSLSLTSIDGINNQPDLDTIYLDGLGFTSIDGFKSINLTTFEFTPGDNGGIEVTSISSDSFLGTPLEDLNIEGHTLTDVSFLSNQSTLLNLSISVDILDISTFTTMPFAATLETFDFGNVQDITDYSVFNTYDNIQTFNITNNSTTISNFDGFDSLLLVSFSNDSNITTITNSFNNLQAWNPSNDYISNFTSLTSISSSFDVYQFTDTVILTSGYTITDSYNNVGFVNYTAGIETTPMFDINSFDGATLFNIYNPNYDDYAFLDNYNSITTLRIFDPQQNIVNLVHSELSLLEINNIDSTITSFNIDLKDNASLTLSEGDNNPATYTVNFDSQIISLFTESKDVVLNSAYLGNELRVEGDSQNLTINNNDVSTFFSDELEVQNNMTLNMDNLRIINVDVQTGVSFEANTLEVNTTQSTLSNGLRTENTTINSTTLSQLTAPGGIGIAQVNTDVSTFNFSGDYDELTMNDANLTTFNHNGSGDGGTLYLDSNVLATVDLEANVNYAEIRSLVASIDVTGDNTNTFDIIDSSLTSVTLQANNATTTIATTNNQAFTLDAITDDVVINAPNVPSITVEATSDIATLDLGVLDSISDVDFTTATINTVSFETPLTTVDLTGLNITTFNILGVNINDISLNSASSNLFLETHVVTLQADLNVNQFELVNHNNLDTLNLVGTSTITTLVSDSLNLDTINTNNATITTADIDTTRATIDIDGTSITTLTVDGDNIISATLVALDTINYTSNAAGANGLSLTAPTVNTDTNTTTVSIDNSSTVSTLNIEGSSALDTLLMGNSDVGSVTVDNAALSLDVTATNTSFVEVNGNTNTLDFNVPLLTIVDLDLNVNSPITIDTTSETITIQANDDVTLNSSTLIGAGVNIPGSSATFNVDKSNLTFALDGSLDTATFTSSNLVDLDFQESLSITTLLLDNTGVSTYNGISNPVANLQVNTLLTNFNVTGGTNVFYIEIDGPNLTSLNGAASQSITDITTNETSFDLDGDFDQVTLTGNNVIGLNLDQLDFSRGTFTVPNLLSLDTLNINGVNDTLTINIAVDDFVLDSDIPTITINSDPTYNVEVNTTTDNLLLYTNTAGLTTNSPTSNIDLTTSPNISELSGTVETIVLNETINSTVIVDMSGGNITLDSNDITDVLAVGVGNVITTFIINGDSVNNVQTNTVDLGTLQINNDTNDVMTVGTLADFVYVNNNITSSSISFAVSVDGQTYTSNIRTTNFTTTSNANTTYTYTGGTLANVTATDFDLFEVIMSNGDTLSLNATVDTLNVSGITLDTVTLSGTMNNLDVNAINVNVFNVTLGAAVNNELTLNTSLTNLLQISDLMATIQTLNMDSLQAAEMANIHQYLEGTSITLNSVNITNQALFDYLYGNNYDLYVSLENTTNAKENALISTATNDALAEIRLNTFFDHVLDNELITDLQAETMEDAQYYFDGYAASLGLTEQEMIDDTENYGQEYVNNTKASIQATLDNPDASIDFAQIAIDLEALIVADATAATQIEVDNKGYTIIDQPTV